MARGTDETPTGRGGRRPDGPVQRPNRKDRAVGNVETYGVMFSLSKVLLLGFWTNASDRSEHRSGASHFEDVLGLSAGWPSTQRRRSSGRMRVLRPRLRAVSAPSRIAS